MKTVTGCPGAREVAAFPGTCSSAMWCLRSASLALLLSGVDALRVPPTRARPRMTETALKLSIEEAASVFGRLADSQHVYKEPIRTAASGFEFSRRATALPSHLGRSLLPLA